MVMMTTYKNDGYIQQKVKYWNYGCMCPKTEFDWEIIKFYKNMSDRLNYGLGFLLITPVAIFCWIFAATQPFQNGEGNFVLVWLMWVCFGLINYFSWKDYLFKFRSWKKANFITPMKINYH